MDASKPQYKILIVDDTPENIDILANILKPDYKRVVALNGVKALEIAGSGSPPDLVLLDIMMPEMDGYEVCRRLKENEATRDIPVIFVTAKTEVEDEALGFEVGAVDYITKPISPPIVQARVRTHLALREARLTLEKQNQELIEAARLREDVDHIIRHDLKGPLTSIIGMPGLLMLDTNLEPDQIKALKYIKESGYMMLNMINLSLDLLKMERGVYEFDPRLVDLAALLMKILADQEKLSTIKNLKCELVIGGRPFTEGDTFPVMAEELLAFSLFSNLVKNAVEASPKGGIIRVTFERGVGDGLVSVFNHGAVPEEIRDRFFDKYVTAGKMGGTGLGTYSARLMAETMNGSIHLASSEAEGTTVTVRLPLAITEDMTRAESETPPDTVEIMDLPDMRVLVVDDDPHSRELILRWLDHPSLTMDSAGDGREAYDRMTRELYDIVFMDVEMPVMNGFEAISRFRTWETERGSGPTPVIALTGHDSETVRQRLLEAGFTNHLTKPVTKADLVAAINDPASTHIKIKTPGQPDDDAEETTVRVDADFEGLVEGFLEENRNTLAKLRRTQVEENIETIGRLGHTLAGTGRMYGLTRLAQKGATLETAAKETGAMGVESLMADLADYLDRINIVFVTDE